MRLTSLVLPAALCLALPAQAQTDMTNAEREAFRAEVRAYLMENPEVIMEAFGVLQEREAQAQTQADSQMLDAQRDALVDDDFSYVGATQRATSPWSSSWTTAVATANAPFQRSNSFWRRTATSA